MQCDSFEHGVRAIEHTRPEPARSGCAAFRTPRNRCNAAAGASPVIRATCVGVQTLLPSKQRMANRKVKGPRDGASPPRSRPGPPPRTASYTRLLRVDEEAAGAGAPSTLPPPPFARETAVVGLEWWLDAHMGLASGMLWLAQLLDTVPEGDAHAETVRTLAAHTEEGSARRALRALAATSPTTALPRWWDRGPRFREACPGQLWLVRARGGTPRDGDERPPGGVEARLDHREGRVPGVHQPLSDVPARGAPGRPRAPHRLHQSHRAAAQPTAGPPRDQLIAATEELQAMLAKRFA